MAEPESVTVDPIRTDRLELILFMPDVMRAVVDGDLAEAGRLLGAAIPEGVADALRDYFRGRLADLQQDPARLPWLARALVIEDGPWSGRGRVVVGSVGFHGPPGLDGRAEIGYQTEPEFRRRGLTTEAVRGILDWAFSAHGTERFAASIAPDNVASIALVEGLGFARAGVFRNEVVGEELVYERDGWRPARAD